MSWSGGLLHAVGFDLGTSGLKAVLVDESGRVLRSARQPYPLHTPVAGWAEQDPDVWWQALLVTSRTLLDGVAAPDAVGLTGQMHSAVVLGARECAHRPSNSLERPAHGRGMRRAQAATRRRARDLDWQPDPHRVHRHQDPVAAPSPSGSVRPARRHSVAQGFPAVAAHRHPGDRRHRRLGDRRLRGARRRWSDEALEALEIRQAWLPEVHESATLVSRVDRRGGHSSGLRDGTPVAAGAGDQAAAALGSGAVDRYAVDHARHLGDGPVAERAAAVRPEWRLSDLLPRSARHLAVVGGGSFRRWFARLVPRPRRYVRGKCRRGGRSVCRIRTAVQRGGRGAAGRRRVDLPALPRGKRHRIWIPRRVAPGLA